ncbi:hypothetical protein SHIRM173S_08117 [Streptomyces hirsutus]
MPRTSSTPTSRVPASASPYSAWLLRQADDSSCCAGTRPRAPTGPGPWTRPCGTTTRAAPRPRTRTVRHHPRARPNWPPPSATPSNHALAPVGRRSARIRRHARAGRPGSRLLRPLAAADAPHRAPPRVERAGRLRMGPARNRARRRPACPGRPLPHRRGRPRGPVRDPPCRRGRHGGRPLHRPALPRRRQRPGCPRPDRARRGHRAGARREAALDAFERMQPRRRRPRAPLGLPARRPGRRRRPRPRLPGRCPGPRPGSCRPARGGAG